MAHVYFCACPSGLEDCRAIGHIPLQLALQSSCTSPHPPCQALALRDLLATASVPSIVTLHCTVCMQWTRCVFQETAQLPLEKVHWCLMFTQLNLVQIGESERHEVNRGPFSQWFFSLYRSEENTSTELKPLEIRRGKSHVWHCLPPQ